MTASPVVISELMADNKGTLADVDGQASDWIELFNNSSGPVNLAGWHLTDNAATPALWTFPDITLAGHQYLVVFASGKDRAVAGSELHTNFQLSSAGEYLAVAQPDGAIASATTFPPLAEDVSYALPMSDYATNNPVITPGPTGVPLTSVQYFPAPGSINRERTTDYLPQNAIDGNLATVAYFTSPGTHRSDGPQRFAVSFDPTTINRIRINKPGDIDGTGEIPLIDPMDLVIYYSTDPINVPLPQRTYHNVTQLTNGYNGSETLTATSVDFSAGTVFEDRHDSALNDSGFYSLTFGTIANATAVMIQFMPSASDVNGYNHYGVREIQVHHTLDALLSPMSSGVPITSVTYFPGPGGTDRTRVGDHLPAAAVDGNFDTFTFVTSPYTDRSHGQQRLAVTFNPASINRLRINKIGDSDGVLDNPPVDPINLTILYTTDDPSIPAAQRTYQPVTQLTSGYNDTERITATFVDYDHGTVLEDRHDSSPNDAGFYSLTFATIPNATGLAVQFFPSDSDPNGYNHYSVREMQVRYNSNAVLHAQDDTLTSTRVAHVTDTSYHINDRATPGGINRSSQEGPVAEDQADSVVVFNELNYRPTAGGSQWVELYNQFSADVDLSGWSLQGGLYYEFPQGTILSGGKYLVVAANPASFSGSNIVGPFTGNLAARQQPLVLRNNDGRIMDTIDFGRDDPWPVGPDGGGVTLAKTEPFLPSGPAANWTSSKQLGGTPASVNFGAAPIVGEVPFTAIDVFNATNQAQELNRPASQGYDPSLGIDHDLSTVTAATPSGNTIPVIIGLDLGGAHSINRFRVAKSNFFGGGSDIDGTGDNNDFVDLEILYTTDTGPLNQRTYQRVSGLVNGFQGAELLKAATVNSNGTIDNDNHNPSVDGQFWSVTFDAVNATAIGFRVARDPADDVNAVHYIAYEFQAFSPAQPVSETTPQIAFNEIAAATSPQFSLELTNLGTSPAALGGMVIAVQGSTNAEYVLPAQNLAAGGYLQLNQAALGFHPVAGDRLFIYTAGKAALLDARVVDTVSRGRAPQLAGRWLYPTSDTPGAANIFSIEDAIVINEVMYHHRALDVVGQALPVEEPEEWVELYNRSSHAVDLSGWKFDDAIDYRFAVGTTLAPGAYLVVANNPAALAAKYPGITIVGPFSGSLSNSNENVVLADPRGNPADEVHYYSSGYWPAFADGGGASLELRDPRSDNSKAEAWAASNESPRSTWKTFTYSGVSLPDGNPTNWQEFVFGLLDSGEFLIDDITVTANPSGGGPQLIQNSTFSSGTTDKWRILGNHHGEIVADPDNPSNNVLHVTATSVTKDTHNHVETTLKNGASYVNIVDGTTYQISFRARWIGGSNQVNTRLYFNRVAQTNLLPVPAKNGTPGAPNSRFQPNVGPTYSGFQHGPTLPTVGQSVTVSSHIVDPDGVASAAVFYSVNGGAFQSVPMTSADGTLYSGVIPPQQLNAMVQFYVQASDALGAVSTFPAAGVNSRAMYQVGGGSSAGTGAKTFRILMTPADDAFLHLDTNLMSNDRMGATVIYNETEVYYDVGLRLRGTAFARPFAVPVSYNLDFSPAQPFRGLHEHVLLDRSGLGQAGRGGQDEILTKHITERAGGIPAMFDDITQVISPQAQYGGPALLSLANFEDEFLDSQYQDGSDGTVYKLEAVIVLTATVDGNPESLKRTVPNGTVTDIRNLGDNKEQYRWNFLIDNHHDTDDFSRMIDLGKTFDLNGAQLAAAVGGVIDVDEWMRTFAMESLIGPQDTYTYGNPHNFQMYVRPSDNRVLAMPYDLDGNFVQSPSAALWSQANFNVKKVIEIPANTRLFYGHLYDMINTTFNTDYMQRWTTHYGALTAENYNGILNYISQRAAFVKTSLPAPTTFQITTNGGVNESVNADSVTLTGGGWIDVRKIYVDNNPRPLDVKWLDDKNWQITVPLKPGDNALALKAFDFYDNLVGSDTINVTSTLTTRPLQDSLRISEIMYHPADPSPSEIAAGFTDANDFEFIELRNIGATTLDISGAHLVAGVTFDFAGSAVTSLPAGGYVLVVRNTAAFATRYGAGLNVAGQYVGKLDNSGEQLRLEDNLHTTILDFQYDSNWYPSTDGGGPSLVIVDSAAPADSWGLATSWRPSSATGGSPGLTDPTSGVVSRRLFYNNSKFDGANAAANAADDNAIASDKIALAAGSIATFANYTSYSRGINGLMVDIVNTSHNPTVDDFIFRVGNDNSPAAWALAPAPLSITVRAAGAPNTSRVSIIWADGVIRNQWLQVTVKTTLGLSAPDVFYFGNVIGETGQMPGDTQVNASDEIGARNHLRSFLDPAPITDPYDFNRDGFVNAADQIIARGNVTQAGQSLTLIHIAQFALAAALGDPDIYFALAIPARMLPALAESARPSLATREDAAVLPTNDDTAARSSLFAALANGRDRFGKQRLTVKTESIFEQLAEDGELWSLD